MQKDHYKRGTPSDSLLDRADFPDDLLTAKEVGVLLKLDHKTILDRWRSLKLPAPISLGDGPKAAKRWLRGEVLAYIESCIQRRTTQKKVVKMVTANRPYRRRLRRSA